MMIAFTILSVLVSSTMSAVLKDAQLVGSPLKLTQQQKGGNYAYAFPDHRLGIIPAILELPEAGLQSEYVYIESPKNIPHIHKQTVHASPSMLKIISIQEIPLSSSFDKTSKLRERLSMIGLIDRESNNMGLPEITMTSRQNERLDNYLQKTNDRESYTPEITMHSRYNERLDSYLQKLRQSSQEIPKKNNGNTGIGEVTLNLFRQANDSKYLNEYHDDEYVPETGNHDEGMSFNDNFDVKPVGASVGMIQGVWNIEEINTGNYGNQERPSSEMITSSDKTHNNAFYTGSFGSQGKPFSGMITTPSENINIHALNTNKEVGYVNRGDNMNSEMMRTPSEELKIHAFDTNKEVAYMNYRGDINSDISTEAGFGDTMGRIASGKDVPEAEGDSSEAVKVQSLESILKLVGGGKTPPWVKKVEAAPVRVEATDYRTNFSEELCTLWPENLQWSAKAVRASLLVAQDMGDVKTFAKSKFLGLHVENITETAKEASFHIVLAIDLRGAPVARAVRSAQKAVGAAVAGSEAALRVATEYATSPGARFAQLVLKAAQRADDAAQVAKDIIRNVNLNE